MVGAGIAVAGTVQIGQVVAVNYVSRLRNLEADRDREALVAVWRALFGDLRTAGLVVALGGLVLAAVAARVRSPERPRTPRPGENAWIGGSSVLRARIDRCEKERSLRAGLVAVDFYERTSVLAVARDLNR